MAHKVPAKVRKMRTEIWAAPAPGVTLEELERKMIELGNEIVAVDRLTGRILVAEEEKTWQ